MIQVKLLHPDAKLPAFHSSEAAGADLSTCQDMTIPAKDRAMIPLGFATSFPKGYVAIIKDRSGLAAKHGLTTMAGVIDSDYRGEWKVILYNTTEKDYEVKCGDRIAQVVFVPLAKLTIEEVKDLDATTRNSGAFGSSGY